MLGHQAQPDQAAPVLANEGDAAQVEAFEEKGAHPVDVALVRVVLAAHRLVRAPEAHQVGRHPAVPGLHEERDHLAVEEAPGGLAVQHQNRGGVARPLVDGVDAQALHLRVVRLEGVAGQVLEALVGSSQTPHG